MKSPPPPPRLPPAPPPPGLWRRTPPAIFPPILGLFGLGLGWRLGAQVLGLPAGIGEAILGATTLLYLFALAAWAAKPLRRPAVLGEELRVLPGRAGVAAANLSAMFLAAALVPYLPGPARALLWAALGLHLLLAAAVAVMLLRGPAEGRVVSPVMHLLFVGFIVGGVGAAQLGLGGLLAVLFWGTLPVALLIWGASAAQLVRAGVPAPLRPLLAVHLAPAALLGIAAAGLGLPVAAVFGVLSLALLAALLAAARWLTAAGFSPLWGAFTFPLVAAANLWLLLGGPWAVAGAVALAGATLLVPAVALRILRGWADGSLAQRTNAATA